MWFTVKPTLPYLEDRDYRESLVSSISSALVDYHLEFDLRYPKYGSFELIIHGRKDVCDFMAVYPTEQLEILQRLPLVGSVREVLDRMMRL